VGAVVVETFREGALLVATARSGGGDDAPFAFERAADGRFVACLCDGSGDWGEGIAASRLAAREAVSVCARESIARGLASAHEKVSAHFTGEFGAACSAVLVVVDGDGASGHVGWVGSLEALVLRDGEVLHRTAPHLFWLELAASGALSPAELAVFPHKSMITRALGITSPGREPGIDLAGPWPVQRGDLVLLCSGKIREALSAGDVSALASREDLATIVRGLVTTTSTRGEFFELFAVAIRIA
jgi:protein phosphatase